LETTGD